MPTVSQKLKISKDVDAVPTVEKAKKHKKKSKKLEEEEVEEEIIPVQKQSKKKLHRKRKDDDGAPKSGAERDMYRSLKKKDASTSDLQGYASD